MTSSQSDFMTSQFDGVLQKGGGQPSREFQKFTGVILWLICMVYVDAHRIIQLAFKASHDATKADL